MDKTNKVLLLVTAVVVIAAAIYLLSTPKETSNTYTQTPSGNVAMEDEGINDDVVMEDEETMYSPAQRQVMYENYLSANIDSLSEQEGPMSISMVNWIDEDNALVAYTDGQSEYTAEARFNLNNNGEVVLSYFNAMQVQEENNDAIMLEDEINMEGEVNNDVMMEEELMIEGEARP